MQTILEKWSPDSSNCLFQHYVYNNVRPETVPYYGPGPGEDEAKWEEALAKKPSEDAIPVLCKGFAALGNRLRVQVQAVTALQARLHEINGSLTAILQAHDLEVSVRTGDAKRRHIVLSQRCLQLATKIQVLKNRGYALDGAEEGLRKKLMELERGAFDPRLHGRQEEIWARMVGLRERARYLQEEADRTGKSLADNGEGMNPDDTKQIKKVWFRLIVIYSSIDNLPDTGRLRLSNRASFPGDDDDQEGFRGLGEGRFRIAGDWRSMIASLGDPLSRVIFSDQVYLMRCRALHGVRTNHVKRWRWMDVKVIVSKELSDIVDSKRCCRWCQQD